MLQIRNNFVLVKSYFCNLLLSIRSLEQGPDNQMSHLIRYTLSWRSNFWPPQHHPTQGPRRSFWQHKDANEVAGCVPYWNRVQPRGGPQEGICNGVQSSRCPGNIRKMFVGCPYPHRPEPWGMGHMEQGHSELFWVARALQLTPGTVI